MKTIFKKIKIYGNEGFDKVKELKEQGFELAYKVYCFNTLKRIALWKNVP